MGEKNMNRKKFSLGVCQLRTELEYEATMEKAAAMIRDAAACGAGVVVLPEMFSCPYAGEYFQVFAALGHEETCQRLSSWARENRILLIGGSIPEVEGDRLYNSCFVYGPDGELIARHRKAHLFDVDLPGMRFHESHTFTPGSEITVFDSPYGRMGVAICFDVRFPELFRAMARRGAELICLPAQFNTTTGPAHWEVTMRTRAVDNELFFVAASAARCEGFSYECWGHSMILDPFGTKLAEADEKEQLILAELDLNRIDEVRAQLPTFLHLREDLYAVAD
jgi:omega-amidase